MIDLTEDEKAEADAAAAKAAREEEDSDNESDDEEEVTADDLPQPDGTIYDNPEQSSKVLNGFWQAHHEVLKTIPLKYPECIDKYDRTLQAFAAAHGRVTSLGGREDMDYISVRRIVEDDDNDEEQDELDETVLKSFKYTASFRRE